MQDGAARTVSEVGRRARQASATVARTAVQIARAGRNVATDLRHGEWLGRAPLVGAGTTNSDHRVLDQIFDSRIRQGDVLVDLGCGRGRVLSTWLRSFPEHRIVGVEVDPTLAQRTRKRFADRPRCRVIEGDAVAALPEEGTLFFMFNPFGRPTVERLREALEATPPSTPPLRILYSNPRHADVFEQRPGWSVERVQLGGGRLVPHHDLVVIDQVPIPRHDDGAQEHT